MASQSKAEGNRVTIDDIVYELKPAGRDQYSVVDDVGRGLGYIRLSGRRVIPEDYGVEGAHPLAVIGRLWAAAHFAALQPPAPLATKGICRITTHVAPSDEALEKARLRRIWQRAQAGVKASYLVRDPATGDARTIIICQSRAVLDGLDLAAGVDGASLDAASSETFPFVEEP